MSQTLAVTRIHFVRRELTFLRPIMIVVAATLLSMLVYAVLFRFGIAGAGDARYNAAQVYALPGFYAYLGVAMVSTSFPFGLAVGATRRAYAGGTLIAYLALSAYTTVLMTALLGLELLTNHWFAGMYIFDVYALGAGDPVRCAITVFLACLALLSVCGAFAASWIRFRGYGPVGIAVGVIVVGALTLLVAGPRIWDLFAGFRLWWLVVAAIVVSVLAQTGTYLFLRRANVR